MNTTCFGSIYCRKYGLLIIFKQTITIYHLSDEYWLEFFTNKTKLTILYNIEGY